VNIRYNAWSQGFICMELSLHQQFEKQRLHGVVMDATDLEELKSLTQQLIDLYFQQKAATAWAIAEKS